MRKQLNQSCINTPLGSMLAIADDQALYLLEFTDNPRLEQRVATVLKLAGAQLITESSSILARIQDELELYFQGSLHSFTTPVIFYGSPFAQRVWRQLQTVAYNTTQSYGQLASSIQMPSACRAVAQANASNKLAIIIPCHRIVTKSRTIGGYSGGVHRKEWLLRHEQKWRSM
jgi:AraC family transcriptional regulator, regulatory protein of adaptative response / methylated-DNA-[protein]-cysteine methyltransferase